MFYIFQAYDTGNKKSTIPPNKIKPKNDSGKLILSRDRQIFCCFKFIATHIIPSLYLILICGNLFMLYNAV